MHKIKLKDITTQRLTSVLYLLLASEYKILVTNITHDGRSGSVHLVNGKDWAINSDGDEIHFEDDRRIHSFSLSNDDGVLFLKNNEHYRFDNICCLDSSGDLVISVIPDGTITCSDVMRSLLPKVTK